MFDFLLCLLVSRRFGIRENGIVSSQPSSFCVPESIVQTSAHRAQSSGMFQFLIQDESEARNQIEGLLGVMQTWGTVIVILATLMAATVDAKIYERCELARKLLKAGLNGFRGYTIGDCKISIAPSLIHTPICPLSSDPCLFCNFSSFLGRHNLFSHHLVMMTSLIVKLSSSLSLQSLYLPLTPSLPSISSQLSPFTTSINDRSPESTIYNQSINDSHQNQ